jgi:tRNA nucleotidyltransferase (CCA-adding enzyme)
LRNELELILGEAQRSAMMTRLDGLGLLGAIHPSLVWDAWLENRFEAAAGFEPPGTWQVAHPPASDELQFVLWAIRTNPEQAADVGSRLRLTQSTIDAMRSAAAVWSPQAGWGEEPVVSRWVRLLEVHPETALLAVWIALADDDQRRARLARFLGELRFVHPRLDGHGLQRLGLAPGPLYGEILADLRDGWLDGQLTSPEAEQERVRRLLADHSAT